VYYYKFVKTIYEKIHYWNIIFAVKTYELVYNLTYLYKLLYKLKNKSTPKWLSCVIVLVEPIRTKRRDSSEFLSIVNDIILVLYYQMYTLKLNLLEDKNEFDCL
jgi:hypothetical protein